MSGFGTCLYKVVVVLIPDKLGDSAISVVRLDKKKIKIYTFLAGEKLTYTFIFLFIWNLRHLACTEDIIVYIFL